MPLNFQGITACVADSEGRVLPECGLKLLVDNRIECWIPSIEGANFKIVWRVPYFNSQSFVELAIHPFLDGVPMGATIWAMPNLLLGLTGELGDHPTGPSTTRLYQFGKRVLTDRDDVPTLSNSQLNYLNTIVATFVWGIRGMPQVMHYTNPGELAPIHEKSVKNGHSYGFYPDVTLNPTIFIFRYAPRDWLQARDIIPLPPRILARPQLGPKRQRSFSSDVIDIGELQTNDEDTVTSKRLIPASVAPRKRQRAEKYEESDVKPKVENE
ncbi:unnamed protein product [Rhizoctonia solani]|uniref:Uncharacterized protein n=1 Tax=Rhizoctonia solani TaxID=456999 RepID=A0A8H2X610_9AGAM|nr:unnamed protein product [Rhizoctonia solani]